MYSRVIFDSCSQILCNQQDRLAVKLTYCWWGNLVNQNIWWHSASVKEGDIVQLCIRAIDAMSVYVTSYVVPVIYSPVFSRRFADILGLENLESRNTIRNTSSLWRIAWAKSDQMLRLSNGGTVLRQKTWLTLHQEELKPLHSKKSYIFLTKVITVTSLVLLFVEKFKRKKDESTDQEESFQVYKQAED